MQFNPSAFIRIPAENYPDNICIQDKNYVSTYRQTNERANRLAWGLMGRGIGKGDKIAVLLYNCHQIIECFLAMWKSSIIMVPLNTRNSTKENAYILNDCGAKVLLFGPQFIDYVEQLRQEMPYPLECICLGGHAGKFVDYEEMLARAKPDEPDFDVDEEDIHAISYTSGTTGLPRGVIQTYRSRKEIIAKMFMNSHMLINEHEVILHVCPLTHAAGYLATPFYLKGARHIILDKFDREVLLETIERERVTCTLLVPTMIVILLENQNVSKYDLTSLKCIFYGTSHIAVPKLKEAISIFGNIFRQNYGLTEAVQPLTYLTPAEHIINGTEEEEKHLSSAGRRALGVEVKIVDDNDVEVPTDQIGEIVLRGPHISQAYLNLPEITAETNKGGWFHTGDVGYKDKNAYFYLIDRKKDMAISGGFNVYCKEVEMVLNRHPLIRESAVVGVPDDKWGEAIKAFIVLEKNSNNISAQDIIDFCAREKLTKYKIPKIVQFVDDLPKNENGKILKKLLKQM